MIFALLFVCAGAVIFAAGIRAILQGTVAIVRACVVAQPVAGLTALAAAALLPGIFLFSNAASAGVPQMAGSSMAGAALLLLSLLPGLAALRRRYECPPRAFTRDCSALVAAALAFLLFGVTGWPVRLAGLLLVLLALGYVVLVAAAETGRPAEHSLAVAITEAIDTSGFGIRVGLFMGVLGVTAVMMAAHLVVTGGVVLMRSLSLPATAIGMTAGGLALALAQFSVQSAAMRGRRTGAEAGMIVVLSFFDLTCAPGVSALLSGRGGGAVPVADCLCVAAMAAFLLCTVAVRWRLTRPRGLLLIAAYGIYLAYLAVRLNLLSILPFHI